MVNKELHDITHSLSPALKLKDPSGDGAPFVFNSPHSGRIYPQNFIDASALSLLDLRSSEDAYVDELFDHVVEQGGSLLHALFPRAYLDLNRQPYELDPKLFVSQLPPFAVKDTLKVKSGLGVIARVVAEGREIYRQPLQVSDALTRINRLYFPYHGALKALISSRMKKAGYTVLIDCHSMPSKNIPGRQLVRPDFVLGDCYGHSCDPRLTGFVKNRLQDMGYRVAVNKPYAGGFLTRDYGKPGEGVHALQMEISRSLYLNEDTLEKNDNYEALRIDLARLTEQLMTALPNLSKQTPLAAE